MDLRLKGFGRADFAQLDWSPDGRRFSYLGEDRLLLADPARRRARVLPLPAVALEDIEWMTASALAASYLDDRGRVGLMQLDADSGRVLRRWSQHELGTTISSTAQTALAWAPTTHRMAITADDGRVYVTDLAAPPHTRRSRLFGDPSWSPDGRRLLAAVAQDQPGGEIAMAAWPSDRAIALRHVASLRWLPDARSMLALDDRQRLLEIDADGHILRTIRSGWPGTPIAIVRIDPT